MTTAINKSYTVNFWASHPDQGNDDCLTGEDFTTEKAALDYFEDSSKWGTYVIDCSHVELTAVESTLSAGLLSMTTIKVRTNPEYRAPRNSDDSYRQEIAMEAGMLGGCDAYNEVLGC